MTNNLDKPLEVKSVTEFLSYIIKGTEKEQEGYNFYYRGENKEFDYRTPSLYLNKKLTTEGSEYYYRSLINELGKDDYQNSSELVQLLSELQHYGAKTRMLDITSNPLVALYFATQSTTTKPKDETNEGYVYLFKEKERNEKFDTGQTVAIKSALNFIPQEKINYFLSIMSTIEKVLPYEKEGQLDYSLYMSSDDIFEKLKEFAENNKVGDYSQDYYLNMPWEFLLSLGERGAILLELKNEEEDDEGKREKKYELLIRQVLKKKIDYFLELVRQVTKFHGDIKFPVKIFEDLTVSHIVLSSKRTDRIRQQQGAFIYPPYIDTHIFTEGDEVKKRIHNSIMKKSASLNIDGEEYTHIVIPKDKKDTIQKELALIGIDEGFIYPDIQHRSNSLSK